MNWQQFISDMVQLATIIIWLYCLGRKIDKALAEPKSYYIQNIQQMSLLGTTHIDRKDVPCDKQ
jgi:hypothetical protein